MPADGAPGPQPQDGDRVNASPRDQGGRGPSSSPRAGDDDDDDPSIEFVEPMSWLGAAGGKGANVRRRRRDDDLSDASSYSSWDSASTFSTTPSQHAWRRTKRREPPSNLRVYKTVRAARRITVSGVQVAKEARPTGAMAARLGRIPAKRRGTRRKPSKV